MTSKPETTPPARGVVALVTDPKGNVIATEADFDRSGYGGHTMAESQAIRAKDRARKEAVGGYCSTPLRDVLSGYDYDLLWNTMLNAGWKLQVIEVGHDT